MAGQSTPERTVKCPVEGCGAEKLSRGIHLHVRQSKGGGHGIQGEVPEGVDFENLETMGTQEVSMDYPETRDSEQVGRRCPYCKEIFRGKRGVMIHVGRKAGEGPHPQNPKEQVNSDKLAIVRTDEDGNTTDVVEEPVEMPSARRRREREQEAGIKQRLQSLVKEFRHEGKDEAAARLEEILTGA